MEPLLLSIAEAARSLGVGRSKAYELIGDGQLETVTIGRRRLVKMESLKAIAKAA